MRTKWVLASTLLLLLAPLPTLPVAAQAAGPAVIEIRTADLVGGGASGLEPNGKLDTIQVFFDAPIDEETVFMDDFSVQDRTIVGYAMPSNVQIDLWILEGVYDTADTPPLTITPGRLGGTDLVSPPSLDTVDGAAPLLVSTAATVGEAQITLRFSEVVTAGGGMSEADLNYQDESLSGASDFKAGTVIHTTDTEIVFVDLDVNVAIDDLESDLVSPTSNIEDGAGNPAFAAAQPLVKRGVREVAANIASDVVSVRFSVPVTSASGGAVTNQGAFDVVYDAPTDDPIAGVLSAAHVAGQYEVFVTLTDPVSRDDVRSLEPARMQTLADQMVEAGRPLKNIPFTSTAFTDRQAPYPLDIFTEDRNRNGYLDALKIHWSEPVDPVCIDGLTVLNPEEPANPYEVDLQTTQLPFMDDTGMIATIPIKEKSSDDADTGILPNLVSVHCSDGRAPWVDRADPPNEAYDIAMGAILEVDTANPVIVEGEVEDASLNGYIDRIVLHFSEDMASGAPDASFWIVEGYNVTSVTWLDERTLEIQIEEGTMGDTGVTPPITFEGNDLADLAGNSLRSFEGGGFPLIDRAKPRVIAAYGDEGSKLIFVEFSEGVEAVTDPQNDPDGPGRGIQERDFAYQNPGGGNTGIVDVRHNRGDRIVLIDVANPLEDVDFSSNGGGGDQIMPIPEHIREFNDGPREERQRVAGELFGYEERDVTAPGKPQQLTWSPDVTAATLSFEAPPDDADPQWDVEPQDTGAVTTYRVHITNETLPEGLSIKEFMKLPQWADVAMDPEEPVAMGETQQLVITGLCSSTPYHVALVALDEDGNPSDVVYAPALTTLKDATAPEGEMAFLSTTHLVNETGAAIKNAELTGTVAWTGITDEEACEIKYHWVLDENETRTVSSSDAFVTQPGLSFDATHIPVPARVYLHVAAANDDDVLSPTFTYPLHLVPPTDCDPQNVTAPDLVATHKSGFTDLQWGELTKELPEGVELIGWQVWLQREPGDPWERRALLEPPSVGFESRSFVDNIKVSDDARYVVTAYFTKNLCQLAIDEDGHLIQTFDEEGNPESFLDDFDATDVDVVRPPPRVPTWAWVTLTSLSLLVIGGVGLYYGLQRSKLDESWLEEDEELVQDDPFGSDPITDLSAGERAAEDDPFGQDTSEPAQESDAAADAMEISCPACTHLFTVTGSRPMEIRCPNCHASGVLE